MSPQRDTGRCPGSQGPQHGAQRTISAAPACILNSKGFLSSASLGEKQETEG